MKKRASFCASDRTQCICVTRRINEFMHHVNSLLCANLQRLDVRTWWRHRTARGWGATVMTWWSAVTLRVTRGNCVVSTASGLEPSDSVLSTTTTTMTIGSSAQTSVSFRRFFAVFICLILIFKAQWRRFTTTNELCHNILLKLLWNSYHLHTRTVNKK